jgi:FkbM family methyltransferase
MTMAARPTDPLDRGNMSESADGLASDRRPRSAPNRPIMLSASSERRDADHPEDVPNMHQKPLIYDLGMNQGRNIPYYLAKGFRVVAVDAAPNLIAQAAQQYAEAVAVGDLTLVNVCLAETGGALPFYLNTVDTVHSSFVPPPQLGPEWSVVEVPTIRASELLRKYGDPTFVKVDVEGYDFFVLKDLLLSGLRPPNISVEAHTLNVVCALITMGYVDFQLINGREIGRSIARLDVRHVDGTVAPYVFPRHSAGPFGDDLPGPWLNGEAVVLQWIGRSAFYGRGWVDIHARFGDA